MKKLFATIALCAVFAVPAMAGEPFGFIYQDTTHPLTGSGSVSTNKVGTAVCKQYFGIVSMGDCSIKSAMVNGKINSLSHADQYIKNIIGIKTIETKAYGN